MKVRLPKKKGTRLPRKRSLLVLAVVSGLLCGSYFWLKGGSSQPPVKPVEPTEAEHTAQTEHEPQIVLLTHLSGAFEKEGEMLRLGVELAWQDLQELNVSGRLIVRDAGRNASATARLVSELSHDPTVLAIIGHLPIDALVQSAPILEEEELLMIVPANSHEQIIQHSWLLPLVCSDGREGAFAANIVKDWAEGKTAAVIYDPSVYGQLLYEGFMRQARAVDLEAQAFSSEGDALSLQAAVDKALEVDPSVIWLAGSPFWGAEVISALTERGYKGRLLVPRSYGEMVMEDLLGDYLNQLYVLRSALVTDASNGPLQEFSNRFRQLHLREPRWLAVLGYDAMKWIGQLLQNGPVSRAALRDAILAGYNNPEQAYQGLAGPIYFDANGHIQRPLQVTVYRNGRFMPFVEASRKDPST